MLVLTRKTGESIMIGDDIEIIVTRIEFDTIRIAIAAPREVSIFRKEIYEEIQRQKETKGHKNLSQLTPLPPPEVKLSADG